MESTDTNNGWTLVTDKMPENNGTYLVSCENHKVYIADYINNDFRGNFFSGIVAWMPFMVKPYCEKENEDL